VTKAELGKSLVASHEKFTRLCYNALHGGGYQQTRFDKILCEALDKTFTGEITRLIINIPPRHGKTLRAVQAYVARGYAINPKANFIHSSYSDRLVRDNSVAVRDIIRSREYQILYPHVLFRQDVGAVGLWKTSAGGTFLASPAGGAVTGFGAGLLGSGFGGALIIDDPLKPSDALSDTKRAFINRRWESTFRSRLATRRTPVIVIMQRIHELDFTHELLEESGSDEDWHHLVLPCYISSDYVYTQGGVYIEHALPDGALWDAKFTGEQAKRLMSNVQYSQEPSPAKGTVFEREWFGRYGAVPKNIKAWSIYADTATKTKTYSDYSVFQLWGLTTENHGFLIAQRRGKFSVPFLKGEFIQFYNSCLAESAQKRIKISIEDRDSGSGLIQALELDGYSVTAVQRTEGKYSRAVKAAPQILDKRIHIPNGVMGDGVINEAVKFTANNSHRHDDQIDPMLDFINYELPNFNRYPVGVYDV